MDRILEISLPPGLKDQIRDDAKKKGCTVSKYIVSVLDEAKKPRPPPVGPELEAMRKELRRLEAELTGKDLMLQQQEAELRKLRGMAFMTPTGSADIDSDLLKVLKAGPIHDHKLLELLGADDPEAMRAVSRQLQILEALGVVSRTSKGWSLRV